MVFLPAVVVLGYLGIRGLGTMEGLSAGLAGYVFWTLCEYWGHRTVFHFEPERGVGRRLHWMIHGVHHDHPNDPRRLVLPPAFSIPLALLFLAAFVAAFGTPDAWAVAAGFYLGYVIYDTLHFALHHAAPQGPARAAPARAPHAPSLRGSRAWVRRERAVVGHRLPDTPTPPDRASAQPGSDAPSSLKAGAVSALPGTPPI